MYEQDHTLESDLRNPRTRLGGPLGMATAGVNPHPPAPSPTFLGEINQRLGTLGMLLSDVQSSSASVRERLLGAWPVPAAANGTGQKPHSDFPAAEMLARLDLLIERAAECRDNTQALDARV